jgi:hypothetical protein
MAANAPYYARQFTDATNTTNATEPQLAPEEEDYGLSAPPSAAALSPRENSQSSLYADYPARQTSADNTFEENHNFVELLEAAETAAAGQAAQVVGLETADAISTTEVAKGKRKRTSDSAMDDTVVEDLASDSKRRRVDMPTDPQLQDSDHDPHGSKAGHIEPSSESLLNEARAAGVHSAAALFRRSTVRTTRKYTRPPMSKLFMSLQLTPENFLQLQARAKAYMLDLRHPERQNCVGNRGKGDTDMVKLRLFNCVRDFLDDRVGEQFFGEHVEKPGEKEASEAAKALGEEQAPTAEDRLTWPRDGNKIISLVTPLMRRMVTNERQRQYAIETRKGGTKKKDNEGSTEAASPQVTSSPCRNGEHQCETAVDPRIDQYSRHQSPSKPTAWMPNTRSTCKGLISQHRTAMPAAEALAADSSIAKVCLPTIAAEALRSDMAPVTHIHINLTLPLPHQHIPNSRASWVQTSHQARRKTYLCRTISTSGMV